MIVGTEWLVEAEGCAAEKLRDAEILRGIFARIIADLNLKIVGKNVWHQFAGEKGVTGLVALTESHLACHTYPEHELATFNLYCCRERPEWDWEENLREILDAKQISIKKVERGNERETSYNPKSEIQNPKSFGGVV